MTTLTLTHPTEAPPAQRYICTKCNQPATQYCGICGGYYCHCPSVEEMHVHDAEVVEVEDTSTQLMHHLVPVCDGDEKEKKCTWCGGTGIWVDPDTKEE